MSEAGAYVRSIPDILKIGVQATLAYRAELTIWILTATLPLVMLALWNAVAEDGPVAGYDQPAIARYFAATLVVRQLTGAWVVWELNYEIRTGGLSPKLLRPIHPLWTSAGLMFAALPLRVLILGPILAALLWWRPELWVTPDPLGFALFLVSVCLAWVLGFLVQAIFGTLSFWFDQSIGLFGVWFGLWTVFSGYVAPMEVFPAWARGVLDLLPFRAMLATPVELLGGFVTPAEGAVHVLVQAGWTVVAFGVAWALWKRGVRRYGAYGA